MVAKWLFGWIHIKSKYIGPILILCYGLKRGGTVRWVYYCMVLQNECLIDEASEVRGVRSTCSSFMSIQNILAVDLSFCAIVRRGERITQSF